MALLAAAGLVEDALAFERRDPSRSDRKSVV